MKVHHLPTVASLATSPAAGRPATTIVSDSADARLVLFRIDPGQAIPPHVNSSTVLMTIVSGSGIVSGPDGDHAARAGDLIAYEPNELHGMRAESEQIVILATITPRPGTR